MLIDAISDLHGHFPDNLQGGDLLIIAGDLTARHTNEEFAQFLLWLAMQPYNKKIFIGGNHDTFLVGRKAGDLDNYTYLFDSGIAFRDVQIWGSPWSLRFEGINPKAAAFTGNEDKLKRRFDLMPEDIDILVTHSPAWGILDSAGDKYCGSQALRDTLDRVKPKIHICGHIHSCGGEQMGYKHVGKDTMCYNVSIMDENYVPQGNITRIKI